LLVIFGLLTYIGNVKNAMKK